jgi:putative membrane protein insertion efficiency factor
LAARWTSFANDFVIRHREERSDAAIHSGLLRFARNDGHMIARLLIAVARAWQLGPSKVLPPSCRYQPSCSAYAITAIQRYGAARGSWMALKRIGRSHPWGGQGCDPVP